MFVLSLKVLRYQLLVFSLFLGLITANAQSVFNGRVLENKTRISLSGIKVQNLTNKLVAITGGDGRFSIGAKPGDLLLLKGYAYLSDTVLISDMYDKEIFLEPQKTLLNEVTITDTNGHTSNAAKNMILPYDPEFHGQTMVYHRDSKKQYDGGIVLRMHYFKGDEHKKKAAQKKAEERQLSLEISTIFTTDNISHYIPLKEAELDNFILLYTPAIAIYNTKDFNLAMYLNTCYKEWLKLPDSQRHAGNIFKKQ